LLPQIGGKAPAEQVVKEIRHATRRQFSAEEKIRHYSEVWPSRRCQHHRARKPISKVQLARQLAPLGISPNTVRRGALTNKGYTRSQFENP
jgi:hypothetical protein